MRTTYVVSSTAAHSLQESTHIKCGIAFRSMWQKGSQLVQGVSKTNLLLGGLVACYLVVLLLVGGD